VAGESQSGVKKGAEMSKYSKEQKKQMDFSEIQKKVCKKTGVPFTPVPIWLKLGIAVNVKSGIQPINRLRLGNADEDTFGWFIWAGTELSEADDFFVHLHIEHLAEWCPQAIPYLALSPGNRFLIDASGYEDIWLDENLLE
jgi:hypothetical protein